MTVTGGGHDDRTALTDHRVRELPTPVEVARGKWVWAARVPWLPDMGTIRSGRADGPLASGYQALAEALGNDPTSGAALQIRLESSGSSADQSGVVRAVIVGRAPTSARSSALAALVRATLPIELPLHPVSPGEVSSLLTRIRPDQQPLAATAELRRRVEDVSPVIDLESGPITMAVLRWAPHPDGLRAAAATLAWHPTPVTIVLHMEPAQPSPDLLAHFDDVIREVASDHDPARNPIRGQVALQYLRRIRDLPRSALQVRVLVTAEDAVAPGLMESIGMGLTDEQAFEVVRPASPHDTALAADLIDELVAREWGADTGDPVIDELLRIADPQEAAGVLRLPNPAPGGTPGLPSVLIPSLPRAAQSDTARPGDIRLGRAIGGGEVGLSLGELNQHLLVAGLPGFGKTTTVQSLLHRLWVEHRVPFLVLDPAKSDYARLIGALNDLRPADRVRRITLNPQSVALNPLAVPPGSHPAAHAGRVLAAFDAAFSLSTHFPLGYVTLGRGLFAAYENARDGGAPTLRSLYAALGEVISQAGFAGPEAANLKGSLLGRVEFLARGPLGSGLLGDARSAVDWAELLSRPTVIEMRSFAGPAERSLVFALLLSGLISYREANPITSGLGHVTVLEEAHRVLAGGSQAESEGVRLLVEAVAELRGSGEGFAVVDQAPTLLHPGVLKLAGSVLSHRLVEPRERLVVGSALLFDEAQQTDLARLGTGQVALYSAGRVASVVVDVDPVHIDLQSPVIPQESLPSRSGMKPEMPWCFGCRSACSYRTSGPALAGARLTTVAEPIAELEQLIGEGHPVGRARCAVGSELSRRASTEPDLMVFLQTVSRLNDRALALAASTGSRASSLQKGV